MDILNEEDAAAMAKIAKEGDYPLLMMNLNRYSPGEYPGGEKYTQWRSVNKQMISNVGGKILWSLPVEGFILSSGPQQPLDEILAYWYPSHQSFLDMRNFEATKQNFELRKILVDYAIVHRCDGRNPPMSQSLP